MRTNILQSGYKITG